MPRTLRLPLTLNRGGSLATYEQDAPTEITQSVALLLDTEPGERAALPDYGLSSPLGSPVDAVTIADVIATWEERADPAQVVTQVVDQAGHSSATVHPSPPTATEA